MPWDLARPASADYGVTHRKARAQWAATHDPADQCIRCGMPLGPMGPGLHLDHSDDRTHYTGFAHAACNVRAGARAGRARQNVTRLTW